jgi:uncharacterized membrane protein YbaN (DUF454 family)
MSKKLLQGLLVTCGTMFVALGVLGIFLPLLPTTVFLLLAAACYARSSERFHQKLLNHRWLGAYIRNYRTGRGMSRREKTVTLALLWIGLGSTMIWSVSAWWLRALLLVIAASVTVHVARLKVARSESEEPEFSVQSSEF